MHAWFTEPTAHAALAKEAMEAEDPGTLIQRPVYATEGVAATAALAARAGWASTLPVWAAAEASAGNPTRQHTQAERAGWSSYARGPDEREAAATH